MQHYASRSAPLAIPIKLLHLSVSICLKQFIIMKMYYKRVFHIDPNVGKYF